MAGPSSVPLIRYDLASYGLVTEVINATTFRAAGMAGQGNGAFAGYHVYVLKKTDGTIAAPHGEEADCTAYVSASGQFTHAAFSAPLSRGDAILLLHPVMAQVYYSTRYELSSYGLVTAVIDATNCIIEGLSGLGDGTFVGYDVYVLTKADGTTNPPHAEQQRCVGYISATGQFTHLAFTDVLQVGDRIMLLHPTLEAAPPTTVDSFPGATVQNWQAAAQTVTTIGGAGVANKIHSLLLDISALQGTITVRLLQDINAVQQRCYQQDFTVAADGPGLWIINGSLAIYGLLWVTVQSDNALDNGQSIGWQYILETT